MGAPWSKKPDPDESPQQPHFFNVDLSPNMRDELLKMIARAPKTGVTLALAEALELAHRVNLPFTPPVDWDALERRARDQGYSVADQIFDGPLKPRPKPDVDPPGGMGT